MTMTPLWQTAVRRRVRGIRRLCALALIASLVGSTASPVYALPTGGVIQSGDGAIGTPFSDILTVTQTSEKLIVHWDDFSIASSERVEFFQPSADAVALNRVVGTNGSEILGTLTANGQVFLINPNGVLFGDGATVNVGGLVASTLDIDDGDFLAGDYAFGATDAGSLADVSVESGAALGAADGGYVVLLAPQVTNEGTITAHLGTVALGAGGQATVELLGDGLVELVIDASVAGASVVNSGALTADGGLVALHAGEADDWLNAALNQTGTIQADAVDEKDGRIVLTGGDVQLEGALDATGEIDVHGGEVTVSTLTVDTDTAFNLRSNDDVTFTAAATVDGDDSAEVILRADADADGSGTTF